MTQAKEAARDWWVENRQSVVDSLVGTATTFWDENKDSILEAAKEFALDNREEAVAMLKELIRNASATALDTAKDYADTLFEQKYAEQAVRVTSKLAAAGLDPASFDADRDGKVTPDELAEGLIARPSALWAAGVPGLVLLAMYGARKKIAPKVETAA